MTRRKYIKLVIINSVLLLASIISCLLYPDLTWILFFIDFWIGGVLLGIGGLTGKEINLKRLLFKKKG